MECFESKNLQKYADMADAEKAMLIGVKESAMQTYKRWNKNAKQNLCTAVTHSTNFANANGNGNANNNNASNANGVRPDSMRAGYSWLFVKASKQEGEVDCCERAGGAWRIRPVQCAPAGA